MYISIKDAKNIPALKKAAEQFEEQTKKKQQQTQHKQQQTQHKQKEIDTGAQLIIDMFKALF